MTPKIVPRTINDTIILTGFVDSAGEAQQAVDIARGFASKLSTAAAPISAPGSGNSSDGGVVNSLVIRGRDQVSLKVTIAEVQRQILKQLGVSTNTTSGEAQVAGAGTGCGHDRARGRVPDRPAGGSVRRPVADGAAAGP